MATSDRFGKLWGRSEVMQSIFTRLEKVAPTDLSALVTGETGTGKELAARAMHDFGQFPDGPFVVVDCGAIQQNLIESELFGHERSAFTGAERQRLGAFELASGGTVFLDEIGELPIHLQPKLLRVLEQREIQRLGGSGPIPIKVRVIAATHRDLPSMVKSGSFREDLYYRLAEVTIRLPTLAERPDDILFLAEHILSELEEETRITEEVSKLLIERQWPGNVRQLKNVLRRAGLLCDGGEIKVADIHDPMNRAKVITSSAERTLHEDLPLKEAREKWVAPIEKRYLQAVVESHEGNLNTAAAHVGIHRKSLERLLRKHGLRSGKKQNPN